MTDKTRWLGLGPWHEDNESELIDWTAQPQYKGLVKGDYYHAELRYSGRWGDPGHKGELDVVFDDDGKIAFAEFNETTMGNYYVRHFQNVSKRRTEFQFFQDFHDKRRSVAYGRVLANGFKYVEDQILEKQDLDADYDLLTGASFSMKNMIGLKDDVSAQRKDSNHKKQRYYGYTEDYGYGITGWLQVVVEDGKIVRCFYDEIFADHTKDIVYDDLTTAPPMRIRSPPAGTATPGWCASRTSPMPSTRRSAKHRICSISPDCPAWRARTWAWCGTSHTRTMWRSSPTATPPPAPSPGPALPCGTTICAWPRSSTMRWSRTAP